MGITRALFLGRSSDILKEDRRRKKRLKRGIKIEEQNETDQEGF